MFVINGRRWRDRVNGNTYHSVELFNGKSFMSKELAYGGEYGYQETAYRYLIKFYDYGEDFGHFLQDNLFLVIDVNRKKDL